uniref:NXF1/2/3/5-like leucine-rich repeat domain-containing protein n=1 Tax=Prolemur simus TaxID=1328070 RepID=A0A8C8Z7A9_PROSS
MKRGFEHGCCCFLFLNFYYVENWIWFFVQAATTASTCLPCLSFLQISIFVIPLAVPYSVQNKLKPEQMEQLKLTMNKRYDVFQQALDLQKLHLDPDLVGCDMDIILNQRNCMAANLQIIERNFPEFLSLNLRNNKLHWLAGLSDIIEKAPKVKILNLSKNKLKSAWELSNVKGLKLEELWLEGNPLCHTFPDQSTYIRSVVTSVTLPGPLHPLGGKLKIKMQSLVYWWDATLMLPYIPLICLLSSTPISVALMKNMSVLRNFGEGKESKLFNVIKYNNIRFIILTTFECMIQCQ